MQFLSFVVDSNPPKPPTDGYPVGDTNPPESPTDDHPSSTTNTPNPTIEEVPVGKLNLPKSPRNENPSGCNPEIRGNLVNESTMALKSICETKMNNAKSPDKSDDASDSENSSLADNSSLPMAHYKKFLKIHHVKERLPRGKLTIQLWLSHIQAR